MKTRIAYQHEFTRHGVTPAQFLAYIRQQQKKHPGEIAYDCDLRMFAAEGWSFDYTNALPSEKPCAAERGTDKPYEKQTYIRNFDGSTYNEIIEFQFDDDKTGTGYYYTVQIDVDEADAEANTAEQVAAIIARREAKAAKQEADAAKLEAEADEAERKGYTAKWWIDGCRTEAAQKRREAEQTRAAISATETAQQPQEAPQEAPAAEAEQQPTETENAPQAATQAAEGIEITAITYTTDDDPDPAPGLLIHRPGTTRGIIIGDGAMLPDDPADMLTAYGEREYSRDAAGNYIITDGKKEADTVTATERREALERLNECPCENGCPSCVGAAVTGSGKHVLRDLLTRILAE